MPATSVARSPTRKLQTCLIETAVNETIQLLDSLQEALKEEYKVKQKELTDN